MSHQKRARDENTPSNIDSASSFWPFKRFRLSEAEANTQSSGWKPVLSLAGLSSQETTAKPITVESKCSSSFTVWQAANPIRYNARLVAVGPQVEEGANSAHVAPVDLAEHSQHFAAAFNSGKSFQRNTEGLQCLPVAIQTSQACLHTIVGALYSRHILLKPETVEETLRTAHYLGMPTIVIACTAYITRHIAKHAPLEVARLGAELHLDVLVDTAETAIISGHWHGANLQRLIELLSGRCPKDIRTMLHRPSRATMSELEVIEVLRAMPEQPPDLAQAIDFGLLQAHELHALGRHITSLPHRQHASPFWSDIARQVLQCILHPQKGAVTAKVVLWEVEADLFRRPHTPSAEPTELFSPHLRVAGLRYRMVLKTGEDAGLYAKPEQGRTLSEGGIKPRFMMFSLPQVHGRILSSTSACLGDVPELAESKGFGLSMANLKKCVLANMSDLVYANSSGKEVLVLGLHVKVSDKPHH